MSLYNHIFYFNANFELTKVLCSSSIFRQLNYLIFVCICILISTNIYKSTFVPSEHIFEIHDV